MKNEKIAIDFRKNLLEVGLVTKILPEAYTWHFAGTWNHMNNLNGDFEKISDSFFDKSEDLLKRSVSIPININQSIETPQKIRNALLKTLN